jgi:hypothetical protein
MFILLRFINNLLITLKAKLYKTKFFYNFYLIIFINIILFLNNINIIKAKEIIN